ncbi:ABC transporter ATP-binding protein [Pararhizobium mangrovi]|uniref:ABC transporter ATP-binding protein n=1 Tax=Pararhizobium mangrovi TaxID=2590452 RepID=A0A506U7M3_9HYPH|nr:ABC transporter ATP-binding protein [Pararhizobium mangrovi]TPW28955.1 ABC transporter ATP-binding protein [Pararhizobium mangrovi]
MSALAIEHLTAGYRRRPVIHDVSIDGIAAGSLTALVGPNAAGKSTLLRAIAGIVPASGCVRFDGADLLREPIARRAQQLAFMPQSLPQGVGLSVLESIVAGLSVSAPEHVRSGRDARRAAVSVLESLGIVDLAMGRLDTLSGGQRQMAALAQALAREPRILLLDEPTSALDLKHQERVMGAARRLAETGCIVLVVLHDLSLAARWADRVVLLHHGRVVADAPPEEALTGDRIGVIYGVTARVERNRAGRLHIDVGGLAESELG